MPTELNRRLLDGELDLAPISSIEYARHADRLRILPRLCVSSEGAVDSIQLVSRLPLERVRSVAVTPESATSVVLDEGAAARGRARAARRGGGRDAPDRRRGAEVARSRTRRRTTTSAGSGSSGPGCRWCSPSGRRPSRSPPGSPSSRTRSSRRCARARAEPERLALRGERALRLPGRLPRALLREAALPLRAARARRPATRSSSSRATRASSTTVPELRFVHGGGAGREPAIDRGRADGRPTILDKALDGERIDDDDALALLRSRDLVAVGRAANELRGAQDRPGPRDVHRRPEPQLHERLRHRLRLLRLLPPPRRPARGLPAPEAGHLQEDRGDARDRRHRRADAGRPPPRPRHRLLRGPLPLDQGALPDPPARALAARGPARRAPLEADDLGDALRACATRASTRSPAAAPRSSSTASATSSRRRRRRRPSGST